MTLKELRYNAYINALKRNNGNAEGAARDLKVSARAVYTFKNYIKDKQEQAALDAFINNNKI